MKAFKVLVVDDKVSNRDVIRIALSLKKRITNIKEARNGEEAIGMLAEEAFDLVVTDYQMPKGSGVDVLLFLMEKYGTVANVIVVSANLGAFEKDLFEKSPLAGEIRERIICLEKPFSMLNFLDIVSKLLSTK